MLSHEIEQESFRVIRAEMGRHSFSEEELAVVTRVIHATADFDFARTMRFHPQALSQGVAALRRGCTIVTDVHMVEVGITAGLLDLLGGNIICDIRDPEVVEIANAQGVTRASAAMRRNAPHIHDGIVAIGNAPTALVEVVRLVREYHIRPALIVGVPVGFVKAVESKDQLLGLSTSALYGEVPYITAQGRKGGSSVAAAIVNALLRLAVARSLPGASQPG
jgi:precorrin-8X/cobalt-precorrin-8 methylmutase